MKSAPSGVRRAALVWASALCVSMGVQANPIGSVRAGTVVATGMVPDEATKAGVIKRLQDVYGAERVLDHITVGQVVAPAQWTQRLHSLITPALKEVSHGQLTVQGHTVEVRGEVGSEVARQEVAKVLAGALSTDYTVRNGLRVSVREQALIDQTLANRIVEFEQGSAVLRPAGLLVLDEMAMAMGRMPGKRFEIIGHTDSSGSHASNVSLSQARAQAVKQYLVGKGLPAEVLSTLGAGPDQPVASNDTEDGRARNRRIQFRVGY